MTLIFSQCFYCLIKNRAILLLNKLSFWWNLDCTALLFVVMCRRDFKSKCYMSWKNCYLLNKDTWTSQCKGFTYKSTNLVVYVFSVLHNDLSSSYMNKNCMPVQKTNHFIIQFSYFSQHTHYMVKFKTKNLSFGLIVIP